MTGHVKMKVVRSVDDEIIEYEEVFALEKLDRMVRAEDFLPGIILEITVSYYPSVL